MNKVVSGLMIATVAGGMTLASAEAQAWRGRGVGLGIAAGIIGLGVGAAIANGGYDGPRYYSRYDDGCYRGPRECHRTHRRCFENEYGDMVCRGGGVFCERPLICD